MQLTGRAVVVAVASTSSSSSSSSMSMSVAVHVHLCSSLTPAVNSHVLVALGEDDGEREGEGTVRRGMQEGRRRSPLSLLDSPAL